MDLVLTIIGPDRPGLVEALSRLIADHGANWLESRMAQLGGQFAGILRVEVDSEHADELRTALEALDSHSLSVVVGPTGSGSEPTAGRLLTLEVVGQDRPGIVRDLSAALAARGANVEELLTSRESAPMTGETLFRASVVVRIPAEASEETLRRALEAVAGNLMVDVTLEPSSPDSEIR